MTSGLYTHRHFQLAKVNMVRELQVKGGDEL